MGCLQGKHDCTTLPQRQPLRPTSVVVDVVVGVLRAPRAMVRPQFCFVLLLWRCAADKCPGLCPSFVPRLTSLPRIVCEETIDHLYAHVPSKARTPAAVLDVLATYCQQVRARRLVAFPPFPS